jgi:hypothetical protein
VKPGLSLVGSCASVEAEVRRNVAAANVIGHVGCIEIPSLQYVPETCARRSDQPKTIQERRRSFVLLSHFHMIGQVRFGAIEREVELAAPFQDGSTNELPRHFGSSSIFWGGRQRCQFSA